MLFNIVYYDQLIIVVTIRLFYSLLLTLPCCHNSLFTLYINTSVISRLHSELDRLL